MSEIKSLLETQIKGKRKRDVYAYADLGLINILLNQEDPITAFAKFVEEAPRDNVYVSLFSTLEPLSKLETPAKNDLKKAMAFLENRF